MSLRFMFSVVAAALFFMGAAISSAARADVLTLKPDHPDRYVVVKGDTLWDISERFLKTPWLWPKVWSWNPAIRNPHLIYPGDTISLQYVDGEPRLSLERGAEGAAAEGEAIGGVPSDVVRLSPRLRSGPLDPIPPLALSRIQSFLAQPLLVDEAALQQAGYVAAGTENRLILGAGHRFYGRGLGATPGPVYSVFAPGKPLKDPVTGEILGYEADWRGDARVVERGDPVVLQVTRSQEEIIAGDRLLVQADATLPADAWPRAPTSELEGRIVRALRSFSEIGQYMVVAVNLGQRNGLETGHLLYAFGDSGRVADRSEGGGFNAPPEEIGVLYVFRVFEKASYAIVMSARRPIQAGDIVVTP